MLADGPMAASSWRSRRRCSRIAAASRRSTPGATTTPVAVAGGSRSLCAFVRGHGGRRCWSSPPVSGAAEAEPSSGDTKLAWPQAAAGATRSGAICCPAGLWSAGARPSLPVVLGEQPVAVLARRVADGRDRVPVGGVRRNAQRRVEKPTPTRRLRRLRPAKRGTRRGAEVGPPGQRDAPDEARQDARNPARRPADPGACGRRLAAGVVEPVRTWRSRPPSETFSIKAGRPVGAQDLRPGGPVRGASFCGTPAWSPWRARQRRGVAPVGRMHFRRDHCAGLEVHSVLGLVGRCVRPSFRLAIRASGSVGLSHSVLDSRLPLRARSSRIRSSAVGVSMPLSLAIRTSRSQSSGFCSPRLNPPSLGMPRAGGGWWSPRVRCSRPGAWPRRPLGAQSASFGPFAARICRTELTSVVLPTPGPPVMTSAFEASARRTA